MNIPIPTSPIYQSSSTHNLPVIQKSEILKKPTFTYNKDTDLIILGNLDDESLFNLCEVNKYTRDICQNESFWMRRIAEKYGKDLKIDKPKNISWIAYYKYLEAEEFSKLKEKYKRSQVDRLKIILTGRGLKRSGNKDELIARLIDNEIKLKRNPNSINVIVEYDMYNKENVRINKFDTVSHLKHVVTTTNFGVYLFIPSNIYVRQRNDDIFLSDGGVYKLLNDKLSLDEQGVRDGSILRLSGIMRGPLKI